MNRIQFLEFLYDAMKENDSLYHKVKICDEISNFDLEYLEAVGLVEVFEGDYDNHKKCEKSNLYDTETYAYLTVEGVRCVEGYRDYIDKTNQDKIMKKMGIEQNEDGVNRICINEDCLN
ncbi:hypothetical protein [Alkaliphilus sp. B6464]|uniref:hypothetical protein n=1 Tax=Alkaliphilus sp. B6464 TaxID=2731219 RepID=UPI001BA59B1F|nr:hypothetical protein [Alkaliphilus sp. B6464]QUH22181.1 hypothetical protein HYG84_19935 [Alkaliphilus sp. B6464]